MILLNYTMPKFSFFRIKLLFKTIILIVIITIAPLLITIQAGRITESTIISFITSLIISIIIVLWFSRNVAKPIEMLLKTTKEYVSGNFSTKVDIHTNDEIGDLANEFNHMADTLSKSITELTSQNRLLTALRRLDDVSLSEINIKPLAQNITNLINQELSASAGAIAIIDPTAKALKRVAISQLNNTVWMQTMSNLPIRYDNQTVPLTQKDNLLVRAIDERKSFYTTNLYDIQRGVFEPAYSEKLQRDLGIKGIFVYPLVTQNRVIGTIFYLYPVERNQIADPENSIREQFTKEIGRVLSDALLYQDLKDDKELYSAERNKLELVLSGISDAIIAVDLFRNVVIFNQAAETLTGFRRNEVIGKPIDQVIKFYQKDEELSPFNYCPIRNEVGPEIVMNKQDLKLSAKSGKTAYVNLIAGQIIEGSQANIGCILTLHDISRERMLEQMKMDFVSMAAHELRTPLTSVRGYLSVFLQENSKILNPDQFSLLNRVSIGTEQLVALVENLLSVSKIERGAFDITLSPVEWLPLVKQSVTQFEERAKEKKLELQFVQPTREIPLIQADRLRITEVLNNLLSNAIAYTAKGTVKVSVEVQGEEVITHIADTGQGIPDEAIPHLFTKFFRVSGALEQGSKGTGLGLYITKSILDMHHGRIWIHSKLGQGSIFSFALPIFKKGLINNKLNTAIV